jgi:transposase-like protein
MSTCPHCQREEQQVKVGRNPSGSQRYQCKVCQRKYTPEPNEAGYPQEVRDQAVRMYVDGLNFRRIARTLQVNHQSVINWVNAHIAGLPDAPPLAADRPEVVELDELFTFVGEKSNLPSS